MLAGRFDFFHGRIPPLKGAANNEKGRPEGRPNSLDMMPY